MFEMHRNDTATETLVKNQFKKKRRRRRVRRFFTWMIVLALMAGGLYLYGFYKENNRFPWAEERAPISFVKEVDSEVYESFFTQTIDLSSYVEPNDIQQVILRATGTVTNVYVKEGDSVKKGDVLIALDDINERFDVAQNQDALQVAILTGASDREIELAELRLTNAKNKLDYTKAYANFDGVVASVKVSEGDYFTAGQTAMTIVDRSTLKATVEIDEIDMQYVELGQKAVLYFDSYTDGSIEGYVSYIPMLGRYTNQGIGVMDVELTIEHPPARIVPGYTFKGTITSEGETALILVPQSAVTTSRGSSSVLKRNEDGSTTRVPVTVKYLGEGISQLISGDIKVGDTVVTRRTDTSNPFASMGGMGGNMNMSVELPDD